MATGWTAGGAGRPCAPSGSGPGGRGGRGEIAAAAHAGQGGRCGQRAGAGALLLPLRSFPRTAAGTLGDLGAARLSCTPPWGRAAPSTGQGRQRPEEPAPPRRRTKQTRRTRRTRWLGVRALPSASLISGRSSNRPACQGRERGRRGLGDGHSRGPGVGTGPGVAAGSWRGRVAGEAGSRCGQVDAAGGLPGPRTVSADSSPPLGHLLRGFFQASVSFGALLGTAV